MGRWLQRDPLGYVDGAGLYEYVASDPASWIDPLGLSGEYVTTFGLIDWMLTGEWDPSPEVCNAAWDAFDRSNWDRSHGTADAAVDNVTVGIVGSVGGATFDPSNRAGAKETAGTIIVVAEVATGAAAIGKVVAKTGVKGGKKVVKEVVEEAEEVAEGAAGKKAAKSARTPVGRKGQQVDVVKGTNKPTTINGRKYTGHAQDQMQGRGVTPSVVEDAVKHGKKSPGNSPGTTVHTTDQARVVTNEAGDVVTVMPHSGP